MLPWRLARAKFAAQPFDPFTGGHLVGDGLLVANLAEGVLSADPHLNDPMLVAPDPAPELGEKDDRLGQAGDALREAFRLGPDDEILPVTAGFGDVLRDHDISITRAAAPRRWDTRPVLQWPPDCYQRAAAYLIDPGGRLLVFDHVGTTGAGTQVPAGGIKPGEAPQQAVLRELREESGIEDAAIVRKLGETWYVAEPGDVPAGLEEQVHHAFHLRLPRDPAQETWEWDECSDGGVRLHRFSLRWAPLDQAAQSLSPIQALWLEPLRLSLRARG